MKIVRRSTPFRTALSLAVLLSLAACGGGGGSPDDDGATGVSLQGVAAKGLLKNAIVKAYRVNADGSRTLLKEEVTDTTGAYVLTGLPAGELVLVEITAGAATTMIDEATNAEVSLPAGFALRAATVLQDSGSGGSNTLQVTPFSEMAVAKAEAASGGLSKSNVEGANADVRSYVGFDVLQDAPVFDTTGTQPANQAALLLAAVSQLASSNVVSGCSGTQGEKVKCVVEAMATAGTQDSALADQIATAVQATQNDPDEPYAGPPVLPPVQQPVDIVPPDTRNSSVDAAKALIASIRSNASALSGTDGDTLEKRIQAVQTAFESAINPVGPSQRALLQALVAAASELDDIRTGQHADVPFSSALAVKVSDALGAGCTFYSDDTFTTVATDYGNASHVGCRVSHAEVMEGGKRYRIQHAVRISGNEGSYQVNTRIVKQEVNVDGYSVGAPVVLLAFQQTPAEMALLRDETGELTGLTLNGKLAPAVYADGSHDTGAVWVDVSIGLSATVSGNATRLNLLGQFQAQDAGGTTTSTVVLKEGSYLQASLPDDNSLVQTPQEDSESAARLEIEASTTGGHLINGLLQASLFKSDLSGASVPTQSSFTGLIKGAGDVQLFQGQLALGLSNVAAYDASQPDSSSNFLKKSLTLDGALYVPGRSAIEIQLAFSETEGSGVYGLSGYYLQGETRVNLTAAGSEDGSVASTATFSTPSGISMTLTPSVNLIDITKGGVVIGRLDRSAGIINYIDNTRESF